MNEMANTLVNLNINQHNVQTFESEEVPKNQNRRQRNWYYEIKIDVHNFEGKLQPDLFLEWIEKMDQFFDWKEIPENRKEKFASLKLTGHALTWGKNLQNNKQRRGKKKIQNWERMKEKMRGKFLPSDHARTLFQ